MRHLQFWFVVLILWFVGLYNVERYHEPINLTGVFYAFTPGVAVLLLLSRVLQRVSILRLMLLALPLFLILKFSLGYRVIGARLPVTITEIVAIAITIVLSRQIGQALHEFRAAVFDVMCSQLYKSSRPFLTGQAEMYREVRRARSYRRPLALLAVSAASDVQDAPLNRFIEEVQRETVREYVAARIAHVLAEETKDCDIITRRNGHFIILVPEVSRAEAEAILKKLESTAQEKLGLDLKLGLATFPDQEVTFEGLVQRAESTLYDAVGDETEDLAVGSFDVIPSDATDKSRPDSNAECQVIRLQTPDAVPGTTANTGSSSVS
jgi:hypothetical protein